MPTLSALEELESAHIKCPSGANILFYYRRRSVEESTGKGVPVILLLHGYPQNSLMYKHFVDELPNLYNLLVPDLPGYGRSSKPISDDSRGHSKRAWAKDLIHCVDSVFGPHTSVIAFGHDRGGRVAYRLALDMPDRVIGAAMLDIVPTSYVWDAMRIENGHLETKRSHHWITLAAPRPLPEEMISANPRFYFEYTFASWYKKDANAEWVQDGITPFLDPETGKDRIAAVCEDYRAGATQDVEDDRESEVYPLQLVRATSEANQPFKCPLLVLSSMHLRRRFDVDSIWANLGPPGLVESFRIGDESTGHFIVNEKPEECGQHLRNWLANHFETSKGAVHE